MEILQYWSSALIPAQDTCSSPALPNQTAPQFHPSRQTQDKPALPSLITNRRQLLQALNFHADPFNQCVTERETHFRFNEIYVELEEALLDTLSDKAQSAFCFADYGMGKSATRLALEYKLRLDPAYDNILCVRYTPKYSEIDEKSTDDIRDDICVEMAIDSLIQLVERSQRIMLPLKAPAFRDALNYQVGLLPRLFRQTMKKALSPLNPPQKDLANDIKAADIPAKGIFWPLKLRPAVEIISRSDIWHALMTAMMKTIDHKPSRTLSWDGSLDAIHSLGFKQVFILIDALDEETNEPERWIPFLENMFQLLTSLQNQNIFIKCFLPIVVKTEFIDRYKAVINTLTPVPTITTIGHAITLPHLEQILLERLDAVKLHPLQETRLSILFGVHLSEKIETWLAQQAQGSPRRLIQLADSFLDFHADYVYRQTNRFELLPSEWEQFKTHILFSFP